MLKVKVKGEKLDKLFSCWTDVTGLLKHKLGIGCSHTETALVKWISVAQSLIRDRTKELRHRLLRMQFSDEERGIS